MNFMFYNNPIKFLLDLLISLSKNNKPFSYNNSTINNYLTRCPSFVRVSIKVALKQ